MSGMPSAKTIAEVVRASAVTLDEATRLIESYAAAFASGEVIKAISEQHERTMKIVGGANAQT